MLHLLLIYFTVGYQERKFAELESSMMTHHSSVNSMNSDLKGKLTDTGECGVFFTCAKVAKMFLVKSVPPQRHTSADFKAQFLLIYGI